MNEITITTQQELDALPDFFTEFTYVYIKGKSLIYVNKARENSHVEAWGNSHVEARGNSHVEARGNSHVVAWGNSHVEARENSHVVARGNSHVEAWENSHVVAWENSHVEAWGNSHVEAWGNSHVVAWGNSHVEARGNSHVVAWGRTSTQIHSPCSSIVLFAFAVAIVSKKIKAQIKRKSKFCCIHKVDENLLDWFENNGIKKTKYVVLYKRVSSEFKTQEGTENETLWKIGTTLTHPNWDPAQNECGKGKFHAVSRPYFGDEFRSNFGDRYVAIKIAREDLYEWPNPAYPHKIAFRKGKVLYECDSFGVKI